MDDHYTGEVHHNGGRPHSERQVGELLKEFVGEGQRLLREELKLATVEIKREAKQAGQGAGAAAGGGVILHAGFLVLCFALVFGLASVMPAWGAALIVGILLVAVGGFLAWGGVKRLKAVNPKPEQTIQTLKEDKKWAKEMMHGAASKKHVTV